MKIAIVGAGVGGLCSAIFLRQAGFDVDLHEQAPALTAVGAGLRLSPNGLRLLWRAGIDDDLTAIGVRPVAAWELRRWRNGAIVWRGQFDIADGRPRHLLVHRADLLDVLLKHLPGPAPLLNRRLTHLEPGDPSAGLRHRLDFADGSVAEADVVIGADGIHSLICDSFMPAGPPMPSGDSAFRAMVPMDKTVLATRPPAAMLWMGPDKHFVAYPVSSGRLMNVIGVVPSRGGDRESWSATGDRDELATAFTGWDPAVLELIDNATDIKRWALMHRDPLARWTSGSIAVLGDAAHPMLPHLAQGACQAVEDAACLAAVLSGVSDASAAPAALRRYEQLRRTRAAKIQLGSQSQGRSYHLPDGTAQLERDARLADEGIPEQHWIYDHDAAAVA